MVKLIRELIGQGLLELSFRMLSLEKLREISTEKLAKAVKMISENPAPGHIDPQKCWFDWGSAMADGYSHEEINDYLTGVTFTPELDEYVLEPGDRSVVH